MKKYKDYLLVESKAKTEENQITQTELSDVDKERIKKIMIRVERDVLKEKVLLSVPKKYLILDKNISLFVLRENEDAIQYVPKEILTTEFYCQALALNGKILKYIEEQTPGLCALAVSQNGLSLEFVKEQTIEICALACLQNGMALEMVNEEFFVSGIQQIAVGSNPSAITFINCPDQFVIQKAIEKSENILKKVICKQHNETIKKIKKINVRKQFQT